MDQIKELTSGKKNTKGPRESQKSQKRVKRVTKEPKQSQDGAKTAKRGLKESKDMSQRT